MPEFFHTAEVPGSLIAHAKLLVSQGLLPLTIEVGGVGWVEAVLLAPKGSIVCAANMHRYLGGSQKPGAFEVDPVLDAAEVVLGGGSSVWSTGRSPSRSLRRGERRTATRRVRRTRHRASHRLTHGAAGSAPLVRGSGRLFDEGVRLVELVPSGTPQLARGGRVSAHGSSR